jgi:hypothetical protein
LAPGPASIALDSNVAARGQVMARPFEAAAEHLTEIARPMPPAAGAKAGQARLSAGFGQPSTYGAEASIWPWRDPPRLVLHSGVDPDNVWGLVMHEGAHWLDSWATPRRGANPTMLGSNTGHPAWFPLFKAVVDSPSYQRGLVVARERGLADYFTSPPEVWARAFAQHQVGRHGDAWAKLRLTADRYQWSWTDFAPVDREVAKLLERMQRGEFAAE